VYFRAAGACHQRGERCFAQKGWLTAIPELLQRPGGSTTKPAAMLSELRPSTVEEAKLFVGTTVERRFRWHGGMGSLCLLFACCRHRWSHFTARCVLSRALQDTKVRWMVPCHDCRGKEDGLLACRAALGPGVPAALPGAAPPPDGAPCTLALRLHIPPSLAPFLLLSLAGSRPPSLTPWLPSHLSHSMLRVPPHSLAAFPPLSLAHPLPPSSLTPRVTGQSWL
jgi:hypothetical protein